MFCKDLFLGNWGWSWQKTMWVFFNFFFDFLYKCWVKWREQNIFLEYFSNSAKISIQNEQYGFSYQHWNHLLYSSPQSNISCWCSKFTVYCLHTPDLCTLDTMYTDSLLSLNSVLITRTDERLHPLYQTLLGPGRSLKWTLYFVPF